MNTEWKEVTDEGAEQTQKLKVDGGNLYHKTIWNDNAEIVSSSMCFVPDVDLQRYQAHLRDAYKKGYQDGHEDSKNGIEARY
jgi:hypothetical protein